MLKYYLVALLGVFITAFSQILLKVGAMHGRRQGSLIKSYLNLSTFTGYGLLFLVTVLNTYAYGKIELKMAVVLLPLIFVSVALLSYALLRERFSWNQAVGSAIIVAGILVFNL